MVQFNYRISPESVGPNGIITLGGTARLLQEAATDHSSMVGLTPEWYRKNQLGWVAWESKIERLEKITQDEIVQVKTWIFEFEKTRSTRIYRIHNAHNQIVARAWTEWAFIDRNEHNLREIPEAVSSRFNSDTNKNHEFNREKTKIPTNPSDPFCIQLPILYRDIDTQQHANNTVYYDLLEELFHQFIHDTRKSITLKNHPSIQSFYLCYRNETIWRDRLNCKLWIKEDTKSKKFFINFTSDDHSEIICKGQGKLTSNL